METVNTHNGETKCSDMLGVNSAMAEYCDADSEVPEIDLDYGTEDVGHGQVLTNDEKYRLEVLKVQLIHDVLPQHQIETRAGSHAPTPQQRELFEKHIRIKRGHFTQGEDDIITGNWHIFCKLHKWDDSKVEPFVHFRRQKKTYIRSKAERRKFVQFLADGLPDRTLYSVYHRFQNLFTSHKQERYTAEEDMMIIDRLIINKCVNEKRKFADLAELLNRTRASVWRRYRILRKDTKKWRT